MRHYGERGQVAVITGDNGGITIHPTISTPVRPHCFYRDSGDLLSFSKAATIRRANFR